MSSPIRNLTRQTFIYGTGNILSRLITFLLLPIFTNVLSPEEYGIVTLGYVFLGFMNVIYHYGLDNALIRYYRENDRIFSKSVLFSTAIWLLLVSSTVFSIVLYLFRNPIAEILFKDLNYSNIVSLSVFILFFDSISIISNAFLRIEEKSRQFIMIKLVNVLTTLILSIYLVIHLNYGVTGVFISVMIAAVLNAVFLIFLTISKIRFSFSNLLAKDYVKFGIPFLAAGLTAITMELIDRYILASLTDVHTLGIYSAGYKLGIFMLLVSTAFNYACQPFFFKERKSENTKIIFSRVLTYFVMGSAVVWVSVSAFIHEIVRIQLGGYSLIGSQFYGAEHIVPVILLGYMFQGIYYNFLPGIYFENKTKLIPLIIGASAIINITLNYMLIPAFEIIGAAFATMVSYAIMAIVTYFISRKFLQVSYDWNKIAKIGVTAILSVTLIYLFWNMLLVKILSLFFFLFMLYFLKVVTKKEIIRFNNLIFAMDKD